MGSTDLLNLAFMQCPHCGCPQKVEPYRLVEAMLRDVWPCCGVRERGNPVLLAAEVVRLVVDANEPIPGAA